LRVLYASKATWKLAGSPSKSNKPAVPLTRIQSEVLLLLAAQRNPESYVARAPGFTPEGLIAEIRRNSNYPTAEWNALLTEKPLDPNKILTQIRAALNEAESFVAQMPTSKVGLLFLENGEVVQPDPTRLDSYQTHAGQRRGLASVRPLLPASLGTSSICVLLRKAQIAVQFDRSASITSILAARAAGKAEATIAANNNTAAAPITGPTPGILRSLK
jgi:hypothetical protein